MITTKQSTILGYVLVVLGILVFAGYFFYLLEPLQLKLIEAGEKPAFVPTVIRSLFAGTLFATLTSIGDALAAFGWLKWEKKTELKLTDRFKSSSFWTWIIIWNIGFMLFTMFWKYGNF